jgi:hypothetical protein
MIDASEIGRLQASLTQTAPGTVAAALTEDEARRKVAGAMTEGVIVQGASGEVLWFNPAACRLMNLTAEQLMGQEPTDPARRMVHLDGSPVLVDEQPAMVTLRTGLPVRNTTIGINTRKDPTVWLSATSQPAQRFGKPIAITTITDITAELSSRRELEDTVREISRSVVQTHLPRTDRVRVAAKTDVGGPNPEFSGHFYGAHQPSPGRYAFFIGEIEGEGMHAACVTTLARHTLRSAGTLLNDPEAVLHHLHGAVVDEWPDTTMSVIFGYAEFGDDSSVFRLSCAGHGLTLLIRDSGISPIGVAGSLIGTTASQSRPTTTFDARPGEHLLLYTGGLVGRADSGVDANELFAPLVSSMPSDQLAEAAYDLATGEDGQHGPASALVIGIV